MAAGAGAVLLALALAPPAGAQTARVRYETALARERATDPETASLRTLRAIVASYETIVRRFPTSPYSDNALWQAAGVATDAFRRFGDDRDRVTAATLLRRLTTEYPSSSLVRQANERRALLDGVKPKAPAAGAALGDVAAAAAPPAPTTGAVAAGTPVVIRAIQRIPLPNGVRVILELDGEVAYREERLKDPDRLFFDLSNAQPAPQLSELSFPDDLVRRIRLGRHANGVTRVVLDIEDVAHYKSFTLPNPHRLVIDCTRSGPTLTGAAPAVPAPAAAPPPPAAEPAPSPGAAAIAQALPSSSEPGPVPPQFALSPPESAPRVPAAPPSPPSANGNGHFSIARQLGLGVSRIVIDPGHGGQDPGAQASRLTEASLVLDIALRLEKLLLKEPGVDVVMTRRTDVFVPLEERTAIANRTGADLFLSIHANASRNTKLGGVETYFLNFASTPGAEAVAARENAVSGATMAKLPDIVRAIALNNKLDESRDFAAAVQAAMVKKLRTQHRGLRDLGVKQAPFVVLIGASMPSVLAEVSFVTNRDEGRLLRGTSYRQKIAEALFEAIQRYQRSLKKVATVAEQ